jgi:hypothetical protein
MCTTPYITPDITRPVNEQYNPSCYLFEFFFNMRGVDWFRLAECEENAYPQPRGDQSRGGEREAFKLRTTPGPKYAEVPIILVHFYRRLVAVARSGA